MENMGRFAALTGAVKGALIAVDVGFSGSRRSCGICWGEETSAFSFGKAVSHVGERILSTKPDADFTLILEAPLSMGFGKDGNPEYRGEFEFNRGWWYGSGAATLLGARCFLFELDRLLAASPGRKGRVHLAEAFLSNKAGKTDHGQDAKRIYRIAPGKLKSFARSTGRLEPTISGIGIPPIAAIPPFGE